MEGTIIDVPEFPEFAAGHTEGATLVSLATVARSSQEWEKSNPLILVCKSGRRAEQARQNLKRLGFTTFHVLPGEWTRGAQQVRPSSKRRVSRGRWSDRFES